MLVKQMEQRFDNLEGRVDRIEQILPTLATKGDLQAAVEPLATKAELRSAIDAAVEPLATKAELRSAIDAAVEPLATKAELRSAIDAAVEPLATKAELRSAIDAAVEPLATKAELRDLRTEVLARVTESEQSIRTHFDVVTESLRDDIKLIATAFESLARRDP